MNYVYPKQHVTHFENIRNQLQWTFNPLCDPSASTTS